MPRTRLVLAVLLATLVPGVAQAAPRAVAYYASWAIYDRDYHVAEIPAAELTHVSYAFADISPAGECALFDPWADVQQPYPGDGGGPVRGNFRQLQILNDANANCWSDTYATARTNIAGTFKTRRP